MNDKSKKLIYGLLAILGIIIFILQIFVFEKPDGLVGFLLWLICIWIVITSLIRLVQLSKKIHAFFINLLDILFGWF